MMTTSVPLEQSFPVPNGKTELRQHFSNMHFTHVHSTTLAESMDQELFHSRSTFLKIGPEPEQERLNSSTGVPCFKNVEHGNYKKHSRNKNNKNLQAKRRIDHKGPQEKIIKGQWSDEEDRSLVELVKRYGTKNWTKIAKTLSGRVGKQCRDRWENHLRPDIKKGAWSEEEEKLLIELHMQFGSKWSEIARRMPDRSENTIKNHWYATKRKMNSFKDGLNYAKHNNNLLHNYIRGISSTSSREHHNNFEDVSISKDSTSQELESVPTAQHDKANLELDQNHDLPYIPLSLTIDQHGSEVGHHRDPSYLRTSLEFDEKREMDFFRMLLEDFH